MSEPANALGNAHYGEGIAEITELSPHGMITLRGDLKSAAVRKGAKAVAFVDVPAPLSCNSVENNGIAWMSPDELLVMCPYADVPQALESLNKAFGKHHALAVNVSDARTMFRIQGPHAREVLAKLAPVDLDPTVFTIGAFRRTRLAQVPAAFWMRDQDAFQLICFRSHARYVFDLLRTAAAPGSWVNAPVTRD